MHHLLLSTLCHNTIINLIDKMFPWQMGTSVFDMSPQPNNWLTLQEKLLLQDIFLWKVLRLDHGLVIHSLEIRTGSKLFSLQARYILFWYQPLWPTKSLQRRWLFGHMICHSFNSAWSPHMWTYPMTACVKIFPLVSPCAKYFTTQVSLTHRSVLIAQYSLLFNTSFTFCYFTRCFKT